MGSKMSCHRSSGDVQEEELAVPNRAESSDTTNNEDSSGGSEKKEEPSKKRKRRPNQLQVLNNNNNSRKMFLSLETPTGNMSKIIGETPSGIPMRFVDETPMTPSVKPFGLSEVSSSDVETGFPNGKHSQPSSNGHSHPLRPANDELMSPTTAKMSGDKNYNVIKDFLSKYYTTKVELNTPVDLPTDPKSEGDVSDAQSVHFMDRKLVLSEKLTPIQETTEGGHSSNCSEKSMTPDLQGLPPKPVLLSKPRSQFHRMSITEAECSKMLRQSKEELYQLNMIEFRIKCLKRTVSSAGDNIKINIKLNGSNVGEQKGESYSLSTAAALIAERKLYLEKRVELETIHCKSVRNILRGDPYNLQVIGRNDADHRMIDDQTSEDLSEQEPSQKSSSSGYQSSIPEHQGTHELDSRSKIEQEVTLPLMDMSNINEIEIGSGTFYRNLEQDMKDVKTLLFRLQGVMQVTPTDCHNDSIDEDELSRRHEIDDYRKESTNQLLLSPSLIDVP